MISPWSDAGTSPSSMLSVVVLSVIGALWLARRQGPGVAPTITVRALGAQSASTGTFRMPTTTLATGAHSTPQGTRRGIRLPRSPLRAWREYDPYRRLRVVTGRDAHVQWWERARAFIVLGIIVAVLGFALAIGVAALVLLLLVTLEAAVG